MKITNNLKKNFTLMGIPDPLAPNEIKGSDAYGLEIAKSIQAEWFRGGVSSKDCLFTQRHLWIRNMRLFNRGEQDLKKYKDLLARNPGDVDLLNLDWEPANYAEKFTNIVTNGISEEFYRLDIRSADRFALLEKKKKYDQHRKNMAAKKMLQKALAIHDIDLMPSGFVPEDEEELNLYSQIKERPKHEIAEEIMIDFVKAVSRWPHIKSQCDEDIVVADIMVARVITDPLNGVMVKYEDPEAYGHSYVERKDFSDAFYHFVLDTITINELRRESGFSDTELRKIAKQHADFNNASRKMNFDTVAMENIVNFRVHVMHFCFKSDKEIVMKKYNDNRNRTNKVAFRDSNYQVPEGHENSRMSKTIETWYEGSYVVDSNEFIYNYKESENVEHDEMDRVLSPIVTQSTKIYKNKLKSFLSNIIPMINKLIVADLKLQHLMLELKPDLTVINLNQLAELNTGVKGESKSDNWEMALSILGVKGVVLEETINMGDEGGIQKGQSARPAPNQQGSAMVPLLNLWAHHYNKIREVTGINPARDGSLSEDALVGVNQLMQLASNTATKHIVDAATMFDKRVCETISARIKGVFSHAEAQHIQKMYETAVGKHTVEPLKSLKNRHIHEFGFTIEMVPSKKQLDELEVDLRIALEEKTIDISDKAEIMRIARSNIKQAIEYMSFIRRRNIKEKMKEVEYNQKLQSQSNAQSAQIKSQSEAQSYQLKKQMDMQAYENTTMIDLKKKQAEIQIERPGKEQEFKQDVFLEQIRAYQNINLKNMDNDAKRQREIENSTRQSKMIEQRTKDLGAFNFKNELDLESILNA